MDICDITKNIQNTIKYMEYLVHDKFYVKIQIFERYKDLFKAPQLRPLCLRSIIPNDMESF